MDSCFILGVSWTIWRNVFLNSARANGFIVDSFSFISGSKFSVMVSAITSALKLICSFTKSSIAEYILLISGQSLKPLQSSLIYSAMSLVVTITVNLLANAVRPSKIILSPRAHDGLPTNLPLCHIATPWKMLFFELLVVSTKYATIWIFVSGTNISLDLASPHKSSNCSILLLTSITNSGSCKKRADITSRIRSSSGKWRSTTTSTLVPCNELNSSSFLTTAKGCSSTLGWTTNVYFFSFLHVITVYSSPKQNKPWRPTPLRPKAIRGLWLGFGNCTYFPWSCSLSYRSFIHLFWNSSSVIPIPSSSMDKIPLIVFGIIILTCDAPASHALATNSVSATSGSVTILPKDRNI